jgi:hypothetical protein
MNINNNLIVRVSAPEYVVKLHVMWQAVERAQSFFSAPPSVALFVFVSWQRNTRNHNHRFIKTVLVQEILNLLCSTSIYNRKFMYN